MSTAAVTLWILYASTVSGCSIGLTQLRYRNLSLMYCIPANNSNENDPCLHMLNGHKALCQKDEAESRYVCCGTPELLINLLSPKFIPSNLQNQSAIWNQTSSTMHQYSGVTATSFSRNNGVMSQYSYTQTTPRYLSNGGLLQPLPYVPTVAGSQLATMNYRQILMPIQKIRTTDAYSHPEHRFSTISTSADLIKQPVSNGALNVAVFKGDPLFINSVQAMESNGPVLSLITKPHYTPGNTSNIWTVTSTVVHVQDGSCSVVVNTGLPIQRNEITANLAAKGVIASKIDYTVITSGLPQFIGNANLFPTSQFIVGQFYAHWTTLALSNVETRPYLNLCSSRTQIMHTPGPSPDSITVIARNVPTMGTVAIAGALFIQDLDLNRTDAAFFWSEDELYASRRKVICLSDWIVPGHSVPTLVTKAHKRQAKCPQSSN